MNTAGASHEPSSCALVGEHAAAVGRRAAPGRPAAASRRARRSKTSRVTRPASGDGWSPSARISSQPATCSSRLATRRAPAPSASATSPTTGVPSARAMRAVPVPGPTPAAAVRRVMPCRVVDDADRCRRDRRSARRWRSPARIARRTPRRPPPLAGRRQRRVELHLGRRERHADDDGAVGPIGGLPVDRLDRRPPDLDVGDAHHARPPCRRRRCRPGRTPRRRRGRAARARCRRRPPSPSAPRLTVKDGATGTIAPSRNSASPSPPTSSGNSSGRCSSAVRSTRDRTVASSER